MDEEINTKLNETRELLENVENKQAIGIILI